LCCRFLYFSGVLVFFSFPSLSVTHVHVDMHEINAHTYIYLNKKLFVVVCLLGIDFSPSHKYTFTSFPPPSLSLAVNLLLR
jgi:hypothetical protein